jgi:hypothetical protein
MMVGYLFLPNCNSNKFWEPYTPRTLCWTALSWRQAYQASQTISNLRLWEIKNSKPLIIPRTSPSQTHRTNILIAGTTSMKPKSQTTYSMTQMSAQSGSQIRPPKIGFSPSCSPRLWRTKSLALPPQKTIARSWIWGQGMAILC